MSYTIHEFTKEYKRKRMPNIRSLGGIYFGISNYDQINQTLPYYKCWEDWNCNRCKFDFLTNETETEYRLEHNMGVHTCDLQSDLILNMFEHHNIPNTTLPLLGMNRYGIGTCSMFEEYNHDKP